MKLSKLSKIVIVFIGLGSMLSAVNPIWIPIMMGDITTFVPSVQIQTVKNTYSVGEDVSITVNTSLSGDRDWVGIYKVGDSNDWDNVIAWNWVGQGTTVLNKNKKPMPAGEYKIRLFFHNSTSDVEATYSFSVSTNSYIYSSLGSYTPKRYPDEGLQDGFVVYSPENAITPNMPVVLFLEGGGEAPHIDDHKGLMKFMASKGYFVIGAESGESYDSNFATGIFENAINIAKQHHNLSVSKLAVMGHSQGGGQAFYVMKYFQDQDNGGYGSDASLVISIDGWFSFNMNQSDLKTLNSKVSFIQMNGLEGTGTDPRVRLSIWNLADISEKSFFILPYNDHYYSKGNLNNILGKKDLLHIIGALTEDTFTGGTQGYNTIPSANKATYQDIYNGLKPTDQYSADCDGVAYNASSQLDQFDINYCTPEAY